MTTKRFFSAIIGALLLTGCHRPENDDSPLTVLLALFQPLSAGYQWDLPAGFPAPVVPSDNPMSQAKVTLGRYLFYDLRLSGNGQQACATCHIQQYAFSDGRKTGLGSTGEGHPRSPQHIVNAAYFSRLTWSNNTVTLLEEQAKAPMYGTGPIELGMNPSAPEAIPLLRADSSYIRMFADAFGGNGSDQITDLNIRKAIASFERTIISGNSYYDQYVNTGNSSILEAPAADPALHAASVLNGALLFNTEQGDCFHCHGDYNYADAFNHQGASQVFYHNNGIYRQTDYDAMATNQKGLYSVTGLSSDVGMFRAPTLRNIGVTHPFMHDGSYYCSGYVQPANNTPAVQTGNLTCAREALKAVVDNYIAGGQHPQMANLDLSQPSGLSLTNTERDHLVEFLMSLTDTEFLSRAALSNPAFGDPHFVSHP